MKLSKLTVPVLLSIVIGIGIISCTGKSTTKNNHAGVEYYRNLQFSETPYDIEKGTHPITADQAKTINSYKFTYDNTGRLLSVEFVRNNVLLDYSSMGGAAKITYTYNGSTQTKHYFNKNNEPIESGGVFAAQYALDTNGNRVGLMFLGKDGSMIENRNKIHSYNWTVLPDGMVKELRYNLAGEETVMNPFCPFYELRFTYNDKGYTTRMANFKADTLYNCTAENCGDIGVSYFTFTPNQNGDLEAFQVFNVRGQMSNLYWGWSKRLTKVDENGYVTETRVFDQDNEYVSGKLIPVTQNSYDSHGALVQVKNMDKDGNVINSPDNGVAIVEYKYDEAGNRTETLNFDKDKVPVTLAAAK
jgi:YD repeat-containing protein